MDILTEHVKTYGDDDEDDDFLPTRRFRKPGGSRAQNEPLSFRACRGSGPSTSGPSGGGPSTSGPSTSGLSISGPTSGPSTVYQWPYQWPSVYQRFVHQGSVYQGSGVSSPTLVTPPSVTCPTKKNTQIVRLVMCVYGIPHY